MKITQAQHAAVVLKSLPRSTADRFLAGLDPHACRTVIGLMAQTEVTTEKLEAAIEELRRAGIEGIEPEKTQSITRFDPRQKLGRPNAARNSSPFAFLKDYETPFLIELFATQQPRSTATILSTMPGTVSSEVLKAVAPETRVEVVRHIAALPDISETEIMELKFALKLRIQRMLREFEAANVQKREISQNDFLREGRSADTSLPPLSVQAVEQLATMSDEQVKKLLRRVDTSHLAPALKACSVRTQNKVLRNMSHKPAAILSREILSVRIDDRHRIERSSRKIAKVIDKIKN